MEEWRPVAGFIGYEVSSNGNVRSAHREVRFSDDLKACTCATAMEIAPTIARPICAMTRLKRITMTRCATARG